MQILALILKFQSATMELIWGLFGNLIFPILLIAGYSFLFRRSSNILWSSDELWQIESLFPNGKLRRVLNLMIIAN